MTRSHAVEQAHAPDLEAAIALLRAQGLRASAARRLVLETLYAADGPLTAEQIAGGLDGRLPRSDHASVYRNLEALEEIGLVRHVHLGHSAGLYARADGRPREYLLCEGCGDVRVLDAAQLDDVRDLIRRRLGHEARFTHFPLPGLCTACSAPARGGGHAHS